MQIHTLKDVGSSRERAIRIVGWIAVLSVVVLSTVPGWLRPHVLPSNHEEHFIAYLLVGCVLGVGYSALRRRLMLGVMLTIGATLLETSQLFIAGRTPSVEDLVASTLGAWGGLVLSVFVRRLLDRAARRLDRRVLVLPAADGGASAPADYRACSGRAERADS